MVRHKSRWLLANIMVSEEKSLANIGKNHIFYALRIMIESAFGMAGSAITGDIHGKVLFQRIYVLKRCFFSHFHSYHFYFSLLSVKYYHPGAKFVIVKVPRDKYKMIRAAFTLLTHINDMPVVVSITSVNGSARTSKISALRTLRKWFDESNQGVKVTNAMLKKLHNQMEELNDME